MDKKILEQRARAFDYLFDAVVVTDLDGIITDWNSGSEELYGYTRSEAIGQSVGMLHVPEDMDRITKEVFAALERDGHWTGELRMVHKTGFVGWIESMVVPLLDDHNTMVGALGINRDISERVRNEERLAYIAHYDQLTALPNRYLLIERIQQTILHARREERHFGILYLDLDNFKNINDEYGHAAGDYVLKQVARMLRETLRASDTVGRLGGDEFVVLLDNVQKPDEAAVVARHIVEQLRRPYRYEGQDIKVSGSIGIAMYPEHGRTVEELLSAADKAMYRVKHSGKDDYQF